MNMIQKVIKFAHICSSFTWLERSLRPTRADKLLSGTFSQPNPLIHANLDEYAHTHTHARLEKTVSRDVQWIRCARSHCG